MTFVLAVLSGAGIGASVVAGRYRRIIRDLDVAHLDAQWTRDDIAAIDHERALAVADKAREHRGRLAAEHVARQVTGLLVNRRRHPIPLPAHTRRSPVPTYGDAR